MAERESLHTNEDTLVEQQGPQQLPEVINVKNQQELLDFAVKRGHPDQVTPVNFPNLSGLDLALGRFYARDNYVDRIQSAIFTTNSQEVAAKLALEASKEIEFRDRQIESDLLDLGVCDLLSEDNREMLVRQNLFRMAPDVGNALGFAIQHGFVDRIDGRNFPPLRALDTDEINSIKAEAAARKVEILNNQLRQVRGDIGFGSGNSMQDELVNALQSKLQKARQDYLALLNEE